MAGVWFAGLRVPPGVEEGDALLWHPALTVEGCHRRRLSGTVYGSRLACNWAGDDGTQVRMGHSR